MPSSHPEALAGKTDTHPDAEEVIKNTAAMIFAGGADTTVSTLRTFMLAMTLFSEAQKKARAELDDVLGNDRLPEFKDKGLSSVNLLHDEADFGPDTDNLISERFLQEGIRDPGNTGTFGFGRRVCPGRFMAEESLFISIASILYLFELSGSRDRSGNETPVEYERTSVFFSLPKNFMCTIKPRSKAAEELILSDNTAQG
ncbi:hypothetical protein M422DRAFT_265171 [Sphaerobolus stellatus SS14]|uniref:Cytochrome P450 n=1 Tax=Sphaerobolus stellatus (strain SS14) TaxID=990650 RepID=A0A0C9UUQ8_SPHS4|nr:hypothetical protein M422DRAFT_265171 [Sphaerobolus stellatus SS14]